MYFIKYCVSKVFRLWPLMTLNNLWPSQQSIGCSKGCMKCIGCSKGCMKYKGLFELLYLQAGVKCTSVLAPGKKYRRNKKSKSENHIRWEYLHCLLEESFWLEIIRVGEVLLHIFDTDCYLQVNKSKNIKQVEWTSLKSCKLFNERILATKKLVVILNHI